MKKTKLLAPFALSAAVFAGGLLSSNTYAAGISYIDVRYLENEQYSSCHIYSSSGAGTMCAEGVGSFDATSGILTLNEIGEYATAVDINVLQDATPDPVTIKSNNDLNIYVSAYKIPIILDLENHQLGVPTDSVFEADSLTLKSGTLSGRISVNDLTINGGTFNDSPYIAEDLDSFTMNGGTYINDKAVWINERLTMSGGTFTADNIGLKENDATFELSGGEMNLGDGDYSGISGLGRDGVVVTISGGELNISNVNNGILLDGDNSSINFNGGVTTIKNASTYAVTINDTTNSENAIKFATGMGIKEPKTYVFWTDDTFDLRSNQTGIVSRSSTVTIANGYTVEKFKGWDIGTIDPINPDDIDEDDVKVPDTGAINSQEGGALSIFAASTLILLSVIALATAHKKHAAGHFKYDK